MKKLLRNEKGGIFVELTLTLTVVLAFYAGTLAFHQAAGRQFRAIIHERNQAIQKIRRQAPPKFLSGGVLSRLGNLGLPNSSTSGGAGD